MVLPVDADAFVSRARCVNVDALRSYTARGIARIAIGIYANQRLVVTGSRVVARTTGTLVASCCIGTGSARPARLVGARLRASCGAVGHICTGKPSNAHAHVAWCSCIGTLGIEPHGGEAIARVILGCGRHTTESTTKLAIAFAGWQRGQASVNGARRYCVGRPVRLRN